MQCHVRLHRRYALIRNYSMIDPGLKYMEKCADLVEFGFRSSADCAVDLLVPINNCHSFTTSTLMLHPLWRSQGPMEVYYLTEIFHVPPISSVSVCLDILLLDSSVTYSKEQFGTRTRNLQATFIKLPTKTICRLSSIKDILAIE